MSRIPDSSFSADVQLRLLAGDMTVPLGQVGPGFAIAEEASTLDPGRGVIEIVVDGERFAWDVFLPNGLVSQSNEFKFYPLT
jgi:hypothetical protein